MGAIKCAPRASGVGPTSPRRTRREVRGMLNITAIQPRRRGGGAEKVKAFLMDAKLPDPRPLIHVCDRFGACIVYLCVCARVRGWESE